MNAPAPIQETAGTDYLAWRPYWQDIRAGAIQQTRTLRSVMRGAPPEQAVYIRELIACNMSTIRTVERLGKLPAWDGA